MTKSLRLPTVAVIILYALLWGASTFYLYLKGADWTFPVFSLAIFGIGLSAIAWGLTRGAKVPETPVARPKLESAAVIGYLVLYAFFFLGSGLSALKANFEPGRLHDVVIIAAKLVAHVGLPMLLLLMLGARIKPLLDPGLKDRHAVRTYLVLAAIILGLMTVISPSLKNIADTHAGIGTLLWAAPASLLWMTIEAGLCEEFLFRAVLQTRLSALFRSAVSGILVTSILFALAHAPGLYLRGDAETFGTAKDVWQVMAYTIAALSPISLMVGVLWARTRSFLLIVLLHGTFDTLPNLADFIRTWAM